MANLQSTSKSLSRRFRRTKKLIEMIKPGLLFKDLQEAGASLLTDVMLDLGLLSGSKQDIMESLEHKKYYPHGIGHWLGMDVHDLGYYFIDDEPRPIEKGMVFTIEPGIYIPEDDVSAPQELRGIGVRIEDNILVTSHGYENLTASCPKEIAELEAIVGQG
jgi:Xaa-Pro aminopeptidase